MIRQQVFGIINLCLIFMVRCWEPPEIAYIGLIGPQFTSLGHINVDGVHAIAAALMAVRDINNNTDGIYDDILPYTQLKVAFRSPRSNYLEAVSSASQMSSLVFDGQGILGLVGTSATDSSKATGRIFSYTPYKIPQVSYGAQSSELGHASLYSYFARTCSSDAYQGRIIARILYHYFSWSTVVVFSSGDTFGTDTMLEFEDEAQKLGIIVEAKASFWPGITDFSDIIDGVLEGGGVLKIFVLLMKEKDAGVLLEQGYKKGLFKEGGQVIGTQYLVSPEVWDAMSADADVAAIMKGAIGVSPTLSRTRDLPSTKKFINRYLSQKSTMYLDAVTGDLICDSSLDDDGNTYLFKGRADGLSSSKLTCCGIDYSELHSDGSDISDLAFFAYDAVVALALGLHVAWYEQHIHNMTGLDLKWAILNNVSFVGVTGPTRFDKGNIGVDAYGQGDRDGGTDFRIFNFDPRNYHALVADGAAAWLSTGLWTAQDSFQPCDMPTDATCSKWVFNTPDNSPPLDSAPVKEVQMDIPTRAGLRVAGAGSLFLTIVFAVMLYLCDETRLIRAAQPVMMNVVLLGAALASVRILLSTVNLSDLSCIVGKWLGHLAFAVSFGALIAKIWHVDAVMNGCLHGVKITQQRMHTLLLSALASFCVYLLVDTFISRPHMSYNEHFDGHFTVRLMKCANKDPTMTLVLFAVEAVALFGGARLCWNTKDAPGAVNDSAYIAMSMYLIVFVCSVTFPIVFLNIKPTPSVLMMIMAVGFVVATLGCALVIFGPKTALLWQGYDVNDNFEIVQVGGAGAGGTGGQNGLQALKLRASGAASSLVVRSSAYFSPVSGRAKSVNTNTHRSKRM